jgi:hypothetical protein
MRQFFFGVLEELDVLALQTHFIDPPIDMVVDPLLVNFFIRAGHDEVFDLHLLQLAHPEDKVARRDLIAERFPDLRDAEGQLAAGRVEYVLEVDEHPLGCLRPQVGERLGIGDRADLGLEHQVEGARLGQFAFALAGMQVEMLQALYVLLFILPKAQLAGLAIDERIGEGLLMARIAPDIAVHQNGRLDTFHIVALVDIVFPPEPLEVIFQLDTKRAVVEGALHPAVDLAAGEDKAAPLAERHDLFQ